MTSWSGAASSTTSRYLSRWWVHALKEPAQTTHVVLVLLDETTLCLFVVSFQPFSATYSVKTVNFQVISVGWQFSPHGCQFLCLLLALSFQPHWWSCMQILQHWCHLTKCIFFGRLWLSCVSCRMWNFSWWMVWAVRWMTWHRFAIFFIGIAQPDCHFSFYLWRCCWTCCTLSSCQLVSCCFSWVFLPRESLLLSLSNFYSFLRRIGMPRCSLSLVLYSESYCSSARSSICISIGFCWSDSPPILMASSPISSSFPPWFSRLSDCLFCTPQMVSWLFAAGSSPPCWFFMPSQYTSSIDASDPGKICQCCHSLPLLSSVSEASHLPAYQCAMNSCLPWTAYVPSVPFGWLFYGRYGRELGSRSSCRQWNRFPTWTVWVTSRLFY